MTQVSRHQLNPDMTKLIYNEFAQFFAKLPSSPDTQSFLSDFLTTTEQTMLSKRYMIMILLMRGFSVEQIKNTLFVSNSAVMSVSSWLKNASSATKNALKMVDKEKNWESFFDKIESILDKLPPGKYQNWSMTGKEKFSRLKSRQVRSRLR